MVHGILIPASESNTPELRQFHELEDYQTAVGGWIEAVDIPDLHVTMYVNEAGLIRGLPFNRRATFLWCHHVPEIRNRVRLVGDAVLVGWPDEDGNTTSLPAHVQALLLGGDLYRVQVRALGSAEWRDDLAPAQHYLEAVVWACLIQEVSPQYETRVISEG